eukprot:TRINITY_DN13680_c0_g1_i1.p1 TRINITY_DN13680_c0_g1~~TRINITY_DN13680_c0_g1_i1.p1  ORF type:complete len:776 (+),score=204.14 TRINITY_DN13680_c0_g1_i1:101-2428(+)
MGSGCFKGSAVQADDVVERLEVRTTPPEGDEASASLDDPSLEASLRPVLKAASKVLPPSAEEVLRLLAVAGAPSRSGAWLAAWCARATPKQRASLLALLRKAMDKALAPSAQRLEREAAAKSRDGEAGAEVVAQLGQLIVVAREALQLSGIAREGLHAAARCLELASRAPMGAGGLDEQPASFFVPALDSIVSVFRFALIRHVSDSVSNLQRWRDFEEEVGLPRCDEHLALLGPGAKAALLGMRLLPEGRRAIPVVVKRESALQDAVPQLPESGAAVLSPYFESESGTKRVNGKLVEGGEGHGLRKEFFILASSSALEKAPVPLFEFHRGTGQHWFSGYANGLDTGASGAALAERYRCFGKLLALALSNQCRLSFSLPPIFFRLLLRPQQSPTLNDLSGFDEALKTSMVKCLRMKDDQFSGLLAVEGLPLTTSRVEYVERQVLEMLAPQAMEHVRGGFRSVIGSESLPGVSVLDLRHSVCPLDARHRSQDFQRVFQIVVEDELASTPVIMKAFWHVVESFTAEEKRQLLVFLTGLDTWPEPGTERITISSPFSAFTEDEHRQMLQMLPQAHTCANTLELPNYYAALKETGGANDASMESTLRRIVGERLRLAISESAGYELDATDALEAHEAVAALAARSPPVVASPATSSSVFSVPAMADPRAVSASTGSIMSVAQPTTLGPLGATPTGGGAATPGSIASVPIRDPLQIASPRSATSDRLGEEAARNPRDIDSFLASIEKLTQERFEPVKPSTNTDPEKGIDSFLEELEAGVLT